MTDPKSGIDSAFAAALDRYSVPEASPDFASRIVSAATTGQSPANRVWPLRGTRRPWTRRVLMGSVALALGTTALAAALLDRAGYRLPALPALITHAPVAAASPRPHPHKHVVPRAAPVPASPVAAEPMALAAATPAIAPELRAEAIRDRFAAMPPAAQKRLVRRVLRREIMAQSRTERHLSRGELPRAVMLKDRLLVRRLANRPALRARVIERIEARREAAVLAPTRQPDVIREMRADRPLPPLLNAPSIDGGNAPGNSGPTIDPAKGGARGARAERINQIRQLRAVRQQIRRQRRF